MILPAAPHVTETAVSRPGFGGSVLSERWVIGSTVGWQSKRPLARLYPSRMLDMRQRPLLENWRMNDE